MPSHKLFSLQSAAFSQWSKVQEPLWNLVDEDFIGQGRLELESAVKIIQSQNCMF